ncbi:MAG: tetratricopeptide repeat protein [Acidobacteriota bacterium]
MTEFTTLAPRRTAPRPLFAIGDVHGHAAALAPLLEHLDRVIAAEYGSEPVDLVHLGDFIDRGPDPLGVLALARLNLGDLSEALSVLRELCRLDPRDEAVRLQLLAVSGQLEGIHVESGFETEAVERPTREELGIA